MNLQQFRYLREAVRQKLNLTTAARTLHTSQPGVSKAIIELEQELGVSVFARHGKRILGLTPPGQQVLDATGIVGINFAVGIRPSNRKNPVPFVPQLV